MNGISDELTESYLKKIKEINSQENSEATLMAESEELKGLLMKVKEESEKGGLQLNIHKTKIMA